MQTHFLVVMLILAIFYSVKTHVYVSLIKRNAGFDQIIFFTDRLCFHCQRNFASCCPFAISPLPDNKARMSDVENEMDARFEV